MSQYVASIAQQVLSETHTSVERRKANSPQQMSKDYGVCQQAFRYRLRIFSLVSCLGRNGEPLRPTFEEPEVKMMLTFDEVAIDLNTKSWPLWHGDKSVAVHSRVVVHYGKAVPVVAYGRIMQHLKKRGVMPRGDEM